MFPFGRKYAATFSGVAVSALQDLFEVNAPSDAVVMIYRITIDQESDPGDAEAEMLQLQMSKAPTATGSGGGTPTARPRETGSAAFGGTVLTNNTTQATGTVVHETFAFNVQAGWLWQPVPADVFILSPSERFVLELPNAPNDPLTMSGTINFLEVGG